MPRRVRILRVPYLIPSWATAQVLLPNLVLVKEGADLTETLLAHELVHVEQIRRLGLLRYWFRYVRLLLRHGYWDHPMEIEAYAGQELEPYLTQARALLA